MDAIGVPSSLEPQNDPSLRPLPDDATAAQHMAHNIRVISSLERTSAYGRQLWHTLDAVRAYLESSAPRPDPLDRPLPAIADSGDDHACSDWQEAYAAVTSVLAGPRGDDGHGDQEAQRIVQANRPPAGG